MFIGRLLYIGGHWYSSVPMYSNGCRYSGVRMYRYKVNLYPTILIRIVGYKVGLWVYIGTMVNICTLGVGIVYECTVVVIRTPSVHWYRYKAGLYLTMLINIVGYRCRLYPTKMINIVGYKVGLYPDKGTLGHGYR